MLRIVDRVTMPGVDRIVDMPRNNSTGMTVSVKQSVPVTIYTFDITDPLPGILEPSFTYSRKDSKLRQQIPVDWSSDIVQAEVASLRKSIPEQFYTCYNAGVQAYLQGDWEDARCLLDEAAFYRPCDGPTSQILNYMKKVGPMPPATWRQSYHFMEEM